MEKQSKPEPSEKRELENGLLERRMEERFLAAAQRVLDLDACPEAPEGILHPHQVPALLGFREFLMDLATRPGGAPESPFCRIVLPPRTGKTVVAGEMILQTGLCAAFVVPTKTLVRQTQTLLGNMLSAFSANPKVHFKISETTWG